MPLIACAVRAPPNVTLGLDVRRMKATDSPIPLERIEHYPPMAPPVPPRKPIGFTAKEGRAAYRIRPSKGAPP